MGTSEGDLLPVTGAGIDLLEPAQYLRIQGSVHIQR